MIALNLFSGHKLLFGIILILFLINFGCILYLVHKERKKDEEEIGEIITSLAHAKPREIENQVEPVEKEKIEKEEVEMVEEVNKPKLEIDKVLEAMQKNLETTPEDAVASFEQEQEEKSIISYQELLNSFKKSSSVVEDTKEIFKADLQEGLEEKKEIPIIEEKTQDVKQMLQSEFKKDLEEIDFHEEETKPKAVETDFKDEMRKANKEEEQALDIDVIDIEEETVQPSRMHASEKEERKEVFPKEKKKFQNTDFISPIYGKLDEKEMDYPTVPQFSRTEVIEELLEDSNVRTSEEGFKETLDVSPLRKEMEDNDEFLENLKHFRGSL